jgi:hypothetical protein
MLDRNFKELLSIFAALRVKYLVVGGYAVSYHAQPRSTKDLDLFIKPDAENARAVYRALAEFGALLSALKAEDFLEPGMFFRRGSPPLMVDILPEIKGVDFDHAWRNRVPVLIDADSGLMASFISRSDLLAAKVAAGRPQDLADATALREAALQKAD